MCKKYKLDTKHAIGEIVAEGTHKGEIGGSIPNNPIACEIYVKNATTCEFNGRVGPLPKYGGFLNSTASGNRFSLAVLSYPPIKIMISIDS
jgi:hypothetical protein